MEGMIGNNQLRVLWCEYPEMDGSLSNYFKGLKVFIQKAGITRIIFRFQDPKVFDIYQFNSSGSIDVCTKPSDEFPNILDETAEGQNQRNACCVKYCDGDYGEVGVWCDGYDGEGKPVGGSRKCSSKCGKAIKCGLNEETAGAFIEFIRDVGIEVYIVPWVASEVGYPNPPKSLKSYITETQWTILDTFQRVVKWVQMVNEYLGEMAITGIVFEPEGSGYDTADALMRLDKALSLDIEGYKGDRTSKFKLGVTKFSFDAPVYLHEIYPEMYNLTRENGGMVEVDATADRDLLESGKYTPKFPETAYTECINNTECVISRLRRFKGDFNDRTGLIIPLFSTEVAPKVLYGMNNKYYNAPTITGTMNTGTINAFGVWKWDAFNEFMDSVAANYKLDGVGIFQYNMVPSQWK